MENLIPVNYDAEQPTVSARDLHEGLEINTDLGSGFLVWLSMDLQKM